MGQIEAVRHFRNETNTKIESINARIDNYNNEMKIIYKNINDLKVCHFIYFRQQIKESLAKNGR